MGAGFCSNDAMTWTECPDCGHIQSEMMKAFSRRTRPRCVRCGGFVEPSSAGRDAMATGVARRRLLVKGQPKASDTADRVFRSVTNGLLGG